MKSQVTVAGSVQNNLNVSELAKKFNEDEKIYKKEIAQEVKKEQFELIGGIATKKNEGKIMKNTQNWVKVVSEQRSLREYREKRSQRENQQKS